MEFSRAASRAVALGAVIHGAGRPGYAVERRTDCGDDVAAGPGVAYDVAGRDLRQEDLTASA